MQYILYTYQTVDGQLQCHAYGPTDQATAQAEAEKLTAATSGLGFMVLLLEEMPS